MAKVVVQRVNEDTNQIYWEEIEVDSDTGEDNG